MARDVGLPMEEKKIGDTTFRFRKMGSEEGKRFIFQVLSAAAPMAEMAPGVTVANWREKIGSLDMASVGGAVRIFLDRVGEARALELVGKLEEYTDVRSASGGYLPLSEQREIFWPTRWSLLPQFVATSFGFQFGPFSFAA